MKAVARLVSFCVFALVPAIGICQTPALVFNRLLNPQQASMFSQCSTGGWYSLGFPDIFTASDVRADEDDWICGVICGVLLQGHGVDQFAEISNLDAISPDDQIIADITGQVMFNGWNSAPSGIIESFNGASDNSQGTATWEAIDPDPTDASVPAFPVNVTGSIDAAGGVSAAISGNGQLGGNYNYNWSLNGNTVQVNGPPGNVFVNGGFWGIFNPFQGGSLSIPFQWQVNGDGARLTSTYNLTTNVTLAAGAPAADGSVTVSGSVTWDIFATLPAP